MAKGGSDDYLAQSERKYKQAKKLLAGSQAHVIDAFSHAVKTHLHDEDDNPDFEKMEDENVARAFAQTMSEYLSKKVEKAFGAGVKDLYKSGLMQLYAGTTKEQLEELALRYRSGFDYTFLPRMAQSFHQRTSQQLYTAAQEHIQREHIPDITKKADLEDRLSQPLDLEEARKIAGLLSEHKGKIPDEALREIIGHKLKKRAA